MAITAALVKQLRDRTGAGMMDSKRALTETDGDMAAATDWLRTKGLAKAAKKSGRVAAEGLVAVKVKDGRGVAVEVNSETDFVAKNSDFREMVGKIADAAIRVDDIEALSSADIDGKPIAEILADRIATIGENLTLRRMASIQGDLIASYVHNAAAPSMGRIGTLVAMNGADADLGEQVAMHIAAANPWALDESDLDPAQVEREKNVQIEIARESGKPEALIERMIVGRMNKWKAEVTLINQPFVVNPDVTVGEAARRSGAEITGFVRMEVGEGIEKTAEDLASEVARTLKDN